MLISVLNVNRITALESFGFYERQMIKRRMTNDIAKLKRIGRIYAMYTCVRAAMRAHCLSSHRQAHARALANGSIHCDVL